VTVRVPASSANLGPGFDALGMALSVHAEIGVVGVDPQPHRCVLADEHHPASVAFRAGGGSGELWVASPIPIGRGLGYSGAMRVGGAVAGFAQRSDDPVAEYESEILALTTTLEGHADNVAASLLGGVVVTAAGRAVRVPVALDPAVVVWVPSTTTSTDQSRATLAAEVPFDDAVFTIGRVALLVAALAAGDVSALADATQDRIHQDRRLAARPDSRHALENGRAAGAWCGWLSGSGPTIALLCPLDLTDAVGAALPDSGSVKVLRIDHEGTVVERSAH
jgi:homoserine kinase